MSTKFGKEMLKETVDNNKNRVLSIDTKLRKNLMYDIPRSDRTDQYELQLQLNILVMVTKENEDLRIDHVHYLRWRLF